MATLKLNNRQYIVPELTFKHFTAMEEQGFSVLQAFRKSEVFLLAMGFVCAVTGEDRDEAERLIEQHVLGGGKIEDIYAAFGEAIEKSGFFRKVLGLDEPRKAKTKTGVPVPEEDDPDSLT